MTPARGQYVVLAGASGFSFTPRKMSGNAIRMIDELTVTSSVPSVVFDNASHFPL